MPNIYSPMSHINQLSTGVKSDLPPAQALFGRLVPSEKVRIYGATPERIEYLARTYYGTELRMQGCDAEEDKVAALTEVQVLVTAEYDIHTESLTYRQPV